MFSLIATETTVAIFITVRSLYGLLATDKNLANL